MPQKRLIHLICLVIFTSVCFFWIDVNPLYTPGPVADQPVLDSDFSRLSGGLLKNPAGHIDSTLPHLQQCCQIEKQAAQTGQKNLVSEKEITCPPISGSKAKKPAAASRLVVLFGTDEREREISRSDVIMLIKYTPDVPRVILVSIPRDSKVAIPGRGENKVNAALAFGGPELARITLENLFQVRIDNYARINFAGFTRLIDILGGVQVDAKKDFLKHWDDNSIYIPKGKNTLDGEHALEYVRFRHDRDGDFGRIARQQEVLTSLARKLLQPRNLLRLPQLVKLARENIKSDIEWLGLIRLAWQFRDIDRVVLEQMTLQTHSAKIDGIWYEIIDKPSLREISRLLRN
ncbi:MAG: LCP family protein [Halanaerobium sp.]|nr:LCP family protein [Halanaerobium sp.]